MEIIGRIMENELTCNNSFIPKHPDILISSECMMYDSETQEIVNNIIDLEANYKLDKNTEFNLSKSQSLNTEIEDNLKDTRKRVLDNFETSLDDVPLSELSANKGNEGTYSVEGFNFEFITEEEAKMKRLYYLNDPITTMDGYVPPLKKVKKHQIPTGKDYLELFKHYSSFLMDTNNSTRPSVRLGRYRVGCEINMSESNDVSPEIRAEAAESYKKIINLYPQENMKCPKIIKF